jgi:hypothetical protein
MKSKIDRVFQMNLMIYGGDREKAKSATRAIIKHDLILDGLWLPQKRYWQRLYKKKEA